MAAEIDDDFHPKVVGRAAAPEHRKFGGLDEMTALLADVHIR
jgi:hypothetical protein